MAEEVVAVCDCPEVDCVDLAQEGVELVGVHGVEVVVLPDQLMVVLMRFSFIGGTN